MPAQQWTPPASAQNAITDSAVEGANSAGKVRSGDSAMNDDQRRTWSVMDDYVLSMSDLILALVDGESLIDSGLSMRREGTSNDVKPAKIIRFLGR